jgi:uncharacterized membrane protein YhiD involved in acid resistance
VLGAVLAYRPLRHGTPERDPEVIHAQIILAIVGALVMLVIGESLARAFGIVGAAGLIRYRAKIKDPKDAGVMLSTLGLGLASGVGLYGLAVFATFFLLLVLWLVESHAPKDVTRYTLKIKATDPSRLQAEIESVLGRHGFLYALESCTDDEIRYEASAPTDQRTAGVVTDIQEVKRVGVDELSWERKKSA